MIHSEKTRTRRNTTKQPASALNPYRNTLKPARHPCKHRDPVEKDLHTLYPIKVDLGQIESPWNKGPPLIRNFQILASPQVHKNGCKIGCREVPADSFSPGHPKNCMLPWTHISLCHRTTTAMLLQVLRQLLHLASKGHGVDPGMAT